MDGGLWYLVVLYHGKRGVLGAIALLEPDAGCSLAGSCSVALVDLLRGAARGWLQLRLLVLGARRPCTYLT